MKAPFLRLISRLTGISTPVFGVSWTPPELDADTARHLLGYLEDRRVLFAPTAVETPAYAVQSVVQMRPVLTDALKKVERSSELGQAVIAIRAACRRFLDQTQAIAQDALRYHDLPMYEQWQFGVALGELRATVGLHASRLAVAYGIDVEEDFASIFPAEVAE